MRSIGRNQLMEFFGLALILFSVGWQIFIEDAVAADRLHTTLDILSAKLNHIWMTLKAVDGQLEARQLDIGFRARDALLENDWGAGLAAKTRFVFYFIGSLLILCSKLMPNEATKGN